MEGKSMNEREDILWNDGEWLLTHQEASEYWKVHWQFAALTSLNQNAGHRVATTQNSECYQKSTVALGKCPRLSENLEKP